MGLAGSNALLIFCGNKRLCTDPTNLTTWPEAKKGEKTRKQTRKQCWSLVTNNALGWTTMRLSSLRGVAFMGRLPYSRRSWMRFPMWYRHVLLYSSKHAITSLVQTTTNSSKGQGWDLRSLSNCLSALSRLIRGRPEALLRRFDSLQYCCLFSYAVADWWEKPLLLWWLLQQGF